MVHTETAANWLPAIDKAAGPVYLAIADALAADIASGRLQAGGRLPPQRTLADQLGIDFTTVSRAYAEARRRGLVDGRVGLGTFVRPRRAAITAEAASGLVDMSMNLPPRFDDPALFDRMWARIDDLKTDGGLDLLLRYQEAGGTGRDRAAGRLWLAPRFGEIAAERVLVAPGAQGALLAILGLLAAPGDTVCAEALAYPGFRALAAHLKIRLVGVAMDGEGILPDAFEAACIKATPKALYCNPTLHNPTTATMSLARREALVAIARRYGVPIIEDDAYGALPLSPVPPLASLAPELVYHVAGLAKSVSPALRIAYLALPDHRTAARVAAAIRATAAMASPLGAAIATNWIEDGTADMIRAAIRAETIARQALASEILPQESAIADPEGFHVWLRLPEPWTRGEFIARLRSAGIGVVGSDAFALTAPPEAVRLGLGVAASRESLRQSLRIVADLLDEPPALSSMVV
ncbi:PLP-dependent aminotransferase family protein [Kaistia dalseonensis]|uniref:DNA-binding transcriptional MocR family regulator n=1 Tax=Kaistia dalseonensis TaxID=410840 RepID=A0ABU0HAF4_9HYPH|nr:PLP-dependent aminotransferase family protein [Kaistia dalseonensis]MCX5495845.1 PLP-dependent aminotransferase family protein [Kaistia dalseonensis]MDQ0438446.1 DNA-binding transcriptional MocR family regulator [Kaistia dalseonensis]